MAEYIPLDDLDPDEEDKNEDKDDDDDDEDSDQEINNPSESTPNTTMNRDYGKEGARPKTAETSFIEGETQGRQTWGEAQSLTKDAWDDLSILYPNAEDDKLEASFFKDKIEVRMKKSGKKFYPLMTKEQTTGKERLNPQLPKEILSALGTDAESLIAKDNSEIRENRQRLREVEKQLKQAEKNAEELHKNAQEIRDYRNKLEETQAKIDALEEEHGSSLENQTELQRLKQMKKNLQKDFENAKKENLDLQKQVKAKEKEQAKVDKIKSDLAKKQKERNTLEERLNTTKTIDELNEREAELKKQIENDKVILEDENTSSQLRAEVEARVAENEEELARLGTQIEEIERERPLREKIKNIFKKYGFTVFAVFLAVGTTIGVIVNALSKGLKAVAKGVGNGLKDLGKKLGQLLPGLIGSIVSLIFKTAGQVVGFLGKNAWLLILAVAVFMVEKIQKKASGASAR